MKTNYLKIILLSLSLIIVNISLFSQVSETVNLSNAGTLSSYPFSNTVLEITDLTITGSIDARDIKFMRDNMTALANIDMTGSTIFEYTGTEGTSGSLNVAYPANELPEYAFYDQHTFIGKISLVSIKLPARLLSIGSYAFYRCSRLANITLYPKITHIGSYVFGYCSKLVSVSLPTSIISVGASLFFYCSGLVSVDLPPKLTSIGHQMFYYCTNLTSINLPPGLTSIEDRAFSNCTRLLSISLPSGLTSIGIYSFSSCIRLRSINLPSGVSYVGPYAFAGCSNLSSVTLPSGLTYIGEYAFSSCVNLRSVDLPEGLTSVRERTFSGCSSLVSVTLPAGLAYIENRAFFGCSSLISAILPCGLISIGSYVFSGCTNLASVTLPADLTSIGEYAFSDCRKIREFINLNPVPQMIDRWTFNYVDISLCKLKVPTSAVIAYRHAASWGSFDITGNGISVSARTNDVNKGYVSGIENRFYSPGEIVTVTANRAYGYSFEKWNALSPITGSIEEEISTDNPFTFTVLHDTILIAGFIENNNSIDGIENIKEKISVYPNPSTGIVNILTDDSIIPEVILFSTDGKLLLKEKTNMLDISVFPDGMYIIQAGDKKMKVVKK